MRGTLLLASEGINGTVAGTREAVDQLLEYLRSDPRLADIDYNAINSTTWSFREFPQYVEQHLDPSKHRQVAMWRRTYRQNTSKALTKKARQNGGLLGFRYLEVSSL